MYGLIYEYCNIWLCYVFSYHPHFNKVSIFLTMLVTFFPPWNMWVLGARMGLVWRGSSKIIFLSFFTKHKVVYVNYSLILTISFCSSIASGLYNSNELPSTTCHETKHSTMSLENYHFNFYYEPNKITCNFIYYFPLMFIKLSF